MLWSNLLIVLLNCMIGIPISMADYGPGKPKLHSDEHTRIYDQIRAGTDVRPDPTDRKSTRLNSSHLVISYAVFCLKKKKKNILRHSNGSNPTGKASTSYSRGYT